MGNMGYCRFRNTLDDLRDCYEHMDDADLDPFEKQAQAALVKMCAEIAADYGDD